MLNWPSTLRVYACTSPVSMRRSFDGLSAAVREMLRRNPLDGQLFVFFNRRGDQCRVLWWEAQGFRYLALRLERGRFHLPWESGAAGEHVMEPSELALILEGIDLAGARRRPRWREFTSGIDQLVVSRGHEVVHDGQREHRERRERKPA